MDGGLNYYDDIPHKRAREDLPLTPTMFGAASQSSSSAAGSGLVGSESWNSRVPWNYPWSARESSRDGYPYSFGSHASSHAAATPPLAGMDASVLPYNSQYSQSPYSSLPQYSQSSSAMDSRISPQLPSYSSYSGQSRTFTPTSQNSSTQYEDNKLNVWSPPTYSLSNHTTQPVITDTKRLFDTASNPYMAANMGLNAHQPSLSSMSPYGQHSLSDFTTSSMSHLEAQARGVVGLQNFVNDAGFLNHATHHPGYPGAMAMGADPYNPYGPNTYPNMYAPAPPPIPYDPYADVKDVAGTLLTIETQFCAQLQMLRFNEPVMCIYNPLEYAWEPHRNYAEKYCSTRKTVLFLGMNPGPYGMAQTGVPFGEVKLVKEWLGITGLVGKPYNEHPKRPVLGFECTRSEVSGSRFWGFLKKYCEKPEVLFKHSYVHNICPLVFMNKTGRNLTPPDLRAAERKPLIEVCHRYLVEVVRLLGVSIIIGVGKFAQREAKAALDEAGIRGIKVESIMHPSPANPAANRGWEDVVHKELEELDVLRFLGPGPKPKPPEETTPPEGVKEGAASTSSNANESTQQSSQGTPSNQSQGTPGTPNTGGEPPAQTKVEASISSEEANSNSSSSTNQQSNQQNFQPPQQQQPQQLATPPASGPSQNQVPGGGELNSTPELNCHGNGSGVGQSQQHQQQQQQQPQQQQQHQQQQGGQQPPPAGPGGLPGVLGIATPNNRGMAGTPPTAAAPSQPPPGPVACPPASQQPVPPQPNPQQQQPPPPQQNAVASQQQQQQPPPQQQNQLSQVSQQQSIAPPISSPAQVAPPSLPTSQTTTDGYHRDISRVPTVPSPHSLHGNSLQPHSNSNNPIHGGSNGHGNGLHHPGAPPPPGGGGYPSDPHHNPHQTNTIPGGAPAPPPHLHHQNALHNHMTPHGYGHPGTYHHSAPHNSTPQYHPGNGAMGYGHLGDTPQYTGHLGQQLFSSQSSYNGPQ